MSKQNVYVDKESADVSEKIPSYTEIVTGKRAIGHRGPDKVPRKYNPISKQNLRQNQIGPELSTTIAENTENVPSLSSKLLLVALIFVLIVIIGAFIWKGYRDYIANRSK